MTLSTVVPDAVVTHGSQGVSWAGVSGTGRLAAHQVPVIDTTGAGDTFVGYLAAGLAGGMGWGASLERATVASALAIQRPGGAVSIPTISDVTRSGLRLASEEHVANGWTPRLDERGIDQGASTEGDAL